MFLHENIKWPASLSADHLWSISKVHAAHPEIQKRCMTKSPIYGQEFTAENSPVTSMFFPGKNVFIWKLGALEVYSLWQWFNYHHCLHILTANPSFVEEPISYCWSHISHKVSYCIPLYSMCFYWFYHILGVLNQIESLTLHPNRSLPPKKTSCRWAQVLDRFWVGLVHVPFPETFEAWSCLHHLEGARIFQPRLMTPRGFF